MEALSRGLPEWSDGDDRPPTFDAHHATDYPFLGLDKVGLTWFFPVNPSYNCVLAQKANILVDALSRSKRVKLDVVNNAMVGDNQLEGI